MNFAPHFFPPKEICTIFFHQIICTLISLGGKNCGAKFIGGNHWGGNCNGAKNLLWSLLLVEKILVQMKMVQKPNFGKNWCKCAGAKIYGAKVWTPGTEVPALVSLW